MAKYVVASPEATKRTAVFFSAHPDRFLFGNDTVRRRRRRSIMRCSRSINRCEKIRQGNYLRVFDEGRKRVRAWEKANVK